MAGEFEPPASRKGFDVLVASEPTPQEKQIQELQTELARERDWRKEDRFVGIVLLTILLNIVFFSVLPTFGGPLAILLLELLILIPLAGRMGMAEIVQIINSVLNRLAGKASDGS